MPAWIPRLIIIVIIWVAVALLVFAAVKELRGLRTNLIIAMFLSFALEPAVNFLHRHGWRRGLATGTVPAIAGGSVGGVVGAFLALPAAAVIQAFLGNYVKRYDVMDSALTQLDQAAPKEPSARRGLWERVAGRWRKRPEGDQG
jgi:predicted PurR-regulated permease PerM